MQSYWIDETADGCSAIRIIIKTETVTAQRMFLFVSERRRYTGFTLIKVFTQRVNQLTAHQCISKFNQSLTSYLKKQHQGLEGDFSHRIRVFFLYRFTSSFRSFFFLVSLAYTASVFHRFSFWFQNTCCYFKKVVNLVHFTSVIILLCPSSFFSTIPEM